MTALLLRFLPRIAIIVGLGLLGWYLLDTVYDRGFAAAEARYRVALAKAAEDGRAEVARQLDAAREENEQNRRDQQDREQKARETHAAALSASLDRERSWRARYQSALAQDASCAAWAREQVKCPIGN